jgi:hypothetical protein
MCYRGTSVRVEANFRAIGATDARRYPWHVVRDSAKAQRIKMKIPAKLFLAYSDAVYVLGDVVATMRTAGIQRSKAKLVVKDAAAKIMRMHLDDREWNVSPATVNRAAARIASKLLAA